jgi:hypothetical protein
MCPDENASGRRVPFDRLDNLPLGAAGVTYECPRGRELGGSTHILRYAVDRSANENGFSLGYALGEVCRYLVNRPAFPGPFKRSRVPAHPDHPGSQATCAKGQADGTADEPNTHNRHRSQTLQD